MLTIRAAHLAPFETLARQQFEAELAAHAKAYAPALADIAGDANVATAVRLAVDRGEGYGFTTRGPVRFYLEMMLSFGSAFDTDPLWGWAGAILRDQQTAQEVRALRLHDGVQRWRHRVAGPDDAATTAALRRVRLTTGEALQPRGEPHEEHMLRLLRRIHPDKCEHVGQRALDELVAEGQGVAAGFGLSGGARTALVILVMFLFGHGAADDGLYPWIGGALRNPALAEPHRRAADLYQKLLLYIDQLLEGRE